MSRSAVANGRVGGFAAISKYQWLVFLVVWLGWTLDSADFGLYALVLRPALNELLGNPPLAELGVIAHPGLADSVSGIFVVSTKRSTSSTEALLAFAVLTRDRKAA